MSSLKELTHASHEAAEAHPFTKYLLSGEMEDDVYATLLANQLLQYKYLEEAAKHIIEDIPGLARADLILQDLTDLDCPVFIYDVTNHYCDYVQKLDDKQLLAHVYVKHMGDLYGGQLIRTKVPGSGLMYLFNDRQQIIQQLRAKLDVSMAEEANKCFEMTLNLFDRIADEYDL